MENKPGVYNITNIPEGKIYIGSSNNIQRRFIQHRFNGSDNGVKKSALEVLQRQKSLNRKFLIGAKNGGKKIMNWDV